jgi:predicted acyltransferase
MLWTSSYVLFAAGWSMLLLALFYWIIDIRGYRRWAFFFIVIGANAITIYVLHRFISLNMVLEHLGHPRGAGLVLYWLFFWCLIEVAAGWLFLWALFRKKLFLRV